MIDELQVTGMPVPAAPSSALRWTLGERLRRARRDVGATQAAFAEQYGIPAWWVLGLEDERGASVPEGATGADCAVPDPFAHVKVGDSLAAGYLATSEDLCFARVPGKRSDGSPTEFVCSRDWGHPGQHIAQTPDEVVGTAPGGHS